MPLFHPVVEVTMDGKLQKATNPISSKIVTNAPWRSQYDLEKKTELDLCRTDHINKHTIQ